MVGGKGKLGERRRKHPTTIYLSDLFAAIARPFEGLNKRLDN